MRTKCFALDTALHQSETKFKLVMNEAGFRGVGQWIVFLTIEKFKRKDAVMHIF